MKTNIFKIAVMMLVLAGLCSCRDKGDECPRRVYPRQESFISDEDLKKYKPYVDVINSMGTFWISEGVTESKMHAWVQISFYCDQLVNNILIDFPVQFSFFIGDDESWKDGDRLPWFTYYEKDGLCFEVSSYTLVDVQLPATPEISIEKAIQTALRKDPLEEFCRYELYYRNRQSNAPPKLCWKLYGKRYNAHIDAITGKMLYWEDPWYDRYPH
jgi:hypothetical protein